MTKYKSSTSSIVALSIFFMHLINDAQLLNASCVAWYPIIVILPLSKM